ncbi:23S rRNA (pseudouridine(1915)-N(3))-methyltransferase RlmH [Aerococcus kribbianus]|uniref:Ribosomal RNA large subunit methyltransferase H n=1 Tax=Aerococcus kribbianus TaxID=2999064 RepID=A0A9X3FN76_9LACT|nr:MULTISPECIES: 23S rRNA (pseudouridine(1915)-N(3))-methyltransferase RlmH [unclassified Aerococcus]MCZ0717384.1 23S rRNA (pseudouridine(1915)-N(3))-methyltransferase RlmH [Aerococcus sp. YH-aer221]MCZ0725672.1 23S rRNA (pseudouridine(1915)-N(3))-methyltransferase RlmH [Aerococcus sp. YH-aer222]
MRVKIIAVGKLKEKYLKQGIAEYAKRLGKYCKFEVIEVKDEATPDSASDKEEEQIKIKEGQRILDKIAPNDYVYVLAIKGKMLSSEELAESMSQSLIYGHSNLVFVIGGSLGTSHELEQRADQLISFGKLTFPHQLMRLVLSEQIYRSFRIQNGHAYHK